MEPYHQVVSVLVLHQLVGVYQRFYVVLGSQSFGLVASQIAPEVHIAKDELVVLSRTSEGSVQSRDGRR